ncbi:MAG: ferritin [Chitinivibrionales bacterium]|nr:ferritin [Chitinivibrionales bacterium]
MVNKKIEDALNKQINNEMYSAYLYMSMSSWADNQGYKGFAKWFMVQYHEEMFHAMKLFGYLQKQGLQPHLATIKEPPNEFSSLLDMFEKTYEHEKFVTKSIYDLTNLAIAEKDHATQILLQWYVMEQVEEEQNDTEIIAKLKMAKENVGGLLILDRELGSRAVKIPLDYSAGVSGE